MGWPPAAPQRGWRPSATAPFGFFILCEKYIKIVFKIVFWVFWGVFLAIVNGGVYPRVYFLNLFWGIFGESRKLQNCIFCVFSGFS